MKRYRSTITGLKKRLATTTEACDAIRDESCEIIIERERTERERTEREGRKGWQGEGKVK